MPDLYLTLEGEGEDRDLLLEFDDRSSVEDVVAQLGLASSRPQHETTTIERISRGGAALPRTGRLSHQDLRSGDRIRLGLDAGLAVDSDRSQVATLRLSAPQPIDYPLTKGEFTIGRSSDADITIDDPGASRRHARLIVSDVVEIADLGSTNGVAVNGVKASVLRGLHHGDEITIGGTSFTLSLAAQGPIRFDDDPTRVAFNRPPRVGRPYVGKEFDLPQPPDNPPRQRLPMIAAAAPLFMGVVLYMLTRNIASVLFIALSPIMVVGSWYEGKRSGRADFAERLGQYHEDLDTVVDALAAERDAEVAARFDAAPASNELLEHASSLSDRLWEREPKDEDFLVVRVGTAVQPSKVKIRVPSGGARNLRDELLAVPPRFEELPPVPVEVPLPEVGVLGVAGPPEIAIRHTRGLLAQAATLQSPNELVICALGGDDSRATWHWMRWLPHTRSPMSPLQAPHLAAGTDAVMALLADLYRVVKERTPTSVGVDRPSVEPHLLILIDDSIPVERARISPLLEAGPSVGMSFIWLATTSRRLPKACGAVIDMDDRGQSADVGFVGRSETISDSSVELLGDDAIDRLARELAPVVDVSSEVTKSGSIPTSASLVEFLGGPGIMDDANAILDRWGEAENSTNLRGPVGANGSGAFSIDLRHDGPHGLVAGTTGAGKSEFLQSMLVGLATTHSPERVTFLLVDYKGGSAFKDCVKLPHTVGLVTDLTPALVLRALTSLRAELHRREHLLNAANAKDLIQMEEMGHPETPPSLIIVVDEFAALAREVPEFVDGVVDIAQRGRSLGLHLLLATQRPRGVVTDNIRANTNLKVALRVASGEESTDVIGSPEAGDIDRSTPGRAYARLGPSELIPFQSAYVGGKTHLEDDGPTVRIADFGFGERTPWPVQRRRQESPDVLPDLDRLVETINRAHTLTGKPRPRRPWLDPLQDLYDLLALPRSATDNKLLLGVADDPEAQWQRVAFFEPDSDGSILIYGGGGSGKTAALRTLATSAALVPENSPVHVYGLDFASRGLEMLEPLPAVADIVAGDDYERFTRLMKFLQSTIADRANDFGRHRASTLAEYRQNTGRASVPRILVLLDAYENFMSNYERVDRGDWIDLMPRLVADGRGVGIHFAMTGGRRSAFPMTLANTVGRRLVLRLAGEDDYLAMNIDPKLVDGTEPPGRCVDGSSILQLALVGRSAATADQATTIRRLAAGLPALEPAPRRIPVLPDDFHLPDDLAAPVGTIPVGLTDELEPFGLPLESKVLIAGPARSGKTTTAVTIAAAASRENLPVVLLSPKSMIAVGDVEPICGVDVIADFAREHLDAGTTVVVDDLHELLDTPAEYPLQDVLDRSDITVFAVCDSRAARGFQPLVANLRSARRTLCLLPDPDMDGDLLGTAVPRTSRRFVPGRGYFADSGHLELVQIGRTT